MTATTTNVNAQAISRLLAASGLTRSRTIKMRVASRSTEGFTVTQRYPDMVYVDYVGGGQTQHYYQMALTNFVVQATKILKDKGYTVTVGESWQSAKLVVTRSN